MAAPKRTGLGRGIGALIPMSEESDRPVDVFFESAGADLVAVPGARLAEIALDDIVPNPQQPRVEFREEELSELIVSIREFGVLQPIVVRPRAGVAEGEAHYELIMGERRLRASKAAGKSTIPAVVKDTADEDMLRDALLENIHRAQLNPLEEASAYQQLLQDFGITQEQLAARIGRSRPQISNTLRLLRLPEAIQAKVAAGVLTAGHARAILSVGDEAGCGAWPTRSSTKSCRCGRRRPRRGGAPPPPPKATKPVAGKRQDQLGELAQRLGDRLDTRVKIALGSSKGTITIDFATVADLRRILTEVGVDPDVG